MASALIKGLLAGGVPRRALQAADPHPAARRRVRRAFKMMVTDDNRAVVRWADVLVLAVKPQQCPEVLAQIAPVVGRSQLVISIAAGIPLRWLQARLPGRPLVRVMPNLPATVGCGFAAITAGSRATARHRAIAKALLACVGDVEELPERVFDAVTAVSGSGPAYLFFLVRAWEEAAKRLGLPADVAERAIRRTVEGSSRLLQASRDPAAVLIQKVASKGGTTEAALKVLARRHVSAHLVEAIQAAARRSKELSWS